LYSPHNKSLNAAAKSKQLIYGNPKKSEKNIGQGGQILHFSIYFMAEINLTFVLSLTKQEEKII
jgi:hypothetical protein